MSSVDDRLDCHISPEFNYPIRGEFITQLLEFIEYPIVKETFSNMLIFNHHCYKKNSRKRHLQVMDDLNQGRQASGYGPSMCDYQIDSRDNLTIFIVINEEALLREY